MRTRLHKRINVSNLNSAVSASGLKHYWLQEQVGVSKSTFMRWRNGRICRIRPKNLERLAELLEVRPSQLTRKSR